MSRAVVLSLNFLHVRILLPERKRYPVLAL